MLQPTRPLLAAAAVAAMAALASCSGKDEEAPGDKVDFLTDIKPVLEENCLPCHNTNTLLGDLNLENRKLAFEPGPEGPFIVPGNPDESKLYNFTLIDHRPSAQSMPKDWELTPEEKELVRAWIEQGAEWPEGPEGHLRALGVGVAP